MAFFDLFRKNTKSGASQVYNKYTMSPNLAEHLDHLLDLAFQAIDEIESKGYKGDLISLSVYPNDENGRFGYDIELLLNGTWFVKYLKSDAFDGIFNEDPAKEGYYIAKTIRSEVCDYETAVQRLHAYLQNYNQTHSGILFNLSSGQGSIRYL